MKSKTIIYALAVILIFVGLLLWGYSAQKGGTTASVQGVDSVNNSKSQLIASETIYDFGSISMKDGNVTKEFRITNPTAQDIAVKTILTSCMCTTAYIESPSGEKGPFGMAGMGHVPAVDEIIKAGESRVVRAVFDPNAHGPAGVGRIDRFIALTDNAGGTLQLEIKALVTP